MSTSSAPSWAGALTRELCRLAWPICISMLSYSAMTVADTLFVGAIGPDALAGVGLAGALAFALLCFGIGLLRGIKVVVSQAVGAGKGEDVDEIAAAGLLLALGMGVVVVALAQLVVLAVPLLSANPAAGEHGAGYFQIRMWAAPLVYVFCSTRETSYGQGNSRAPMVASVIANVVNIGLDYVFIVGLDHGSDGAAWATVLATILEAGLVLFLAKGPGLRCLAQGTRWLGAVLRVGLATGAQFAIEVGAFTFLTVLVAAMSATQMASHQVALSVVQLATLPIAALAEAASVLAGQAVGADEDSLVQRIARASLTLALAYALLCAVILGVGAWEIASLFGDDEAVRGTATPLLHLAILFLLSRAFNVVARGVLRGTGDVRVPGYICVGVSWLVLPPLTWLLGHRAGFGAVGAWLGLTCETVIIALLLWHRLHTGRWRDMAAKARLALADADAAD